MTKPEVTHYGDNPFNEPQEYEGVLYRYEGAEHIAVESCPESVHVYISTAEESDAVRASYERFFGVLAVVETPPEEEDHENQITRVAVELGPRGVILALTDGFALAWHEPRQLFHDRDAVSAEVFMRQSGPALDMRHKAFLASIAEDNVKADLDSILDKM